MEGSGVVGTQQLRGAATEYGALIVPLWDLRSSEEESHKVRVPYRRGRTIAHLHGCLRGRSEDPGELGPRTLRWRLSGVSMRLVLKLPIAMEN